MRLRLLIFVFRLTHFCPLKEVFLRPFFNFYSRMTNEFEAFFTISFTSINVNEDLFYEEFLLFHQKFFLFNECEGQIYEL